MDAPSKQDQSMTRETFPHKVKRIWKDWRAACLLQETLKAQNDSVRALAHLAPLLQGWAYLPFTDAAAGPEFYTHIANDIVVNQRKNIVEAGAGLSTALIGRLLKVNQPQSRLISIEHDAQWLAVVEKLVERDGTRDCITFCHAPLAHQPTVHKALQQNAPEASGWYSHDALNAFPFPEAIDALIIDGPPALHPLARYGAIPYFIGRLAGNSVIFLHDVDRAGERAIVDRWMGMLAGWTCRFHGRYAVISSGKGYHSIPQHTN